MIVRSAKALLAISSALILCSYILHETSFDVPASPEKEEIKEQILMKALIQSLKNGHFEEKAIDDNFSKDAFGIYLERLDYNKRFLLKSDVEELSQYEMQLDDQVNAGDYSFFNLSYEIINKRTKEVQQIYREILAEPFDFEADETIETDSEKRDFALNQAELKELWRKSLKQQALNRITEMEDKQTKQALDSDSATSMTFDEMEAKAREKLLKSHDRWFQRIEKLDRDDRKEQYINAIANVYGPHTGYFAPKDKENFDISMSGQLEGIGAQLQERDGYIKVSSLVPGGPAYRQGDLEEGDLIIKVGQGKEEPVDVVDMRLDDAVKLIRGKKGTVVKLTVEKANGLTEVISITRDIVILEATYAKSVVIENEAGVRVGYIKLPKFYADFNRNGGRSSAPDVKIELEKLKAQKVDGIVLDLRSNGGGSLRDAIQMTGHFIESGPVVQVKGRYGSPEVKSDYNKEVVYDGPLLVMMNHFSASASEILAAAIQDYGRGIILGTQSSFGKGTVQQFYTLDNLLTAEFSSLKPMGAVKLTIQKFYRINGGATQLKGVVPDISFPDQYAYIETGEKEQDFVMPWDEIAAANYTQWNPPYDKEKVISNSLKRIEANSTFEKINENALRLKEQRDQSIIPLNYEAFKARKAMLDEADKKYENLMTEIDGLKVINIPSDIEAMHGDTVKLDINEKWIKNLKKDVYIAEALNVVSDMSQ